jgi:hypothetical protein
MLEVVEVCASPPSPTYTYQDNVKQVVTYCRHYYQRDDWKFKGAVAVALLVDTVGTITMFWYIYHVSGTITLHSALHWILVMHC